MSCTSESDSTGTIIAVTCIVTFLISVTAATFITFIVTYYVCVKRRFHNPKHQQPHEQEKVLYEEVSSPTHTIGKDDLEMRKSPAYGSSSKKVMDTNPVYESCK